MQRGDGSNAYSWWRASHIRTNQSKWLDGNLQEMEDMVQSMLKIIKEDADSFAKRAEMYYKRRPELISFVEETYRTYRALAERYDRISGELHKVNHSLATAFPDVQFPMQDEDDDSSPTEIDPADSVEVPSPKPPKLPQINLRNKRSENNPATEGIERLNSKSQPKKVTSQINEDEANEAIDKLQKSILVLQTEKEFMKSFYESGVSKFWEIEKQITEMQEKVGFLQDEFSIVSDTEEDEERAIMAVAAFNSCKNTLFNLQEQQRRSVEEMRIEPERLKFAKEKLKALESECGQAESEISDENTGTSSSASDLQQGSLDLQSICDRVKDHFEINSDTSAMELAEKIDKLVNKAIGLELAVSSQTAQINRLRTEADHCQKHLSSLDEEKTSLIDDSSSMSDQERTLEELHKIQNLEKHVEHEESVLCTSFNEARHSPSHISEELQSSKRMDQVEAVDPYAERNIYIPRMESRERSEELEISKNVQDTRFKVDEEATLHPKDEEIPIQSVSVPQLESDSRKSQILEKEDEARERNSPQTSDSDSPSHDPDPHLKQLLLNGLEGEENILLDEYTSIIQNYKETKMKFLEVEKKNHEYFSETRTEVNELKSASAVKDDEIRSLQVILGSLQTNAKLRDSITTNNPNLEATNNRDASSGIQDGVSLRAEEDVKPSHTDEPQTMLPIEEKIRKDIAKLHDGNLGFWLRFGTLFREIQSFGIEFQNIQAEIDKLEDTKAQEGNKSSAQQAGKSESAPINKQLRELKTELQVWIEQSALLSGELKSRFSSFCNIQEEISGVLKESAEADIVQFTPFQAAMLQGEVLNMKRENDKVIDELQAGLDHVKGLQADVEKTSSNLLKLHEKLELAISKSGRHPSHHFRHFSSKRRGVSLQAFLYGVKPKKPSIFSCVNPALQRQFSDLGAGRPI